MHWWNIFTVVDVLLLLVYDQYKTQLGPETVFYINNVIWFLGIDLYHLYFTLALWTHDVPSIKEVPRRIVFYPSKPSNLEPRRPKLENSNDTSNVCGAEYQNPNVIEALFEEIYSCDETMSEFQNHPIDNTGWKGKSGGKGGVPKKSKVSRQKETTTRADNEQQDSFSKTNFRGEGVTGQNETTTRADNEEQDSFAKTNFTYIFKRPSASALPPVSD